MSSTIECHGHMIQPATRAKGTPAEWTRGVRMGPAGHDERGRRCRAPNTYPTEAEAVAKCRESGRQIVDGKLRPKTGRRNGE